MQENLTLKSKLKELKIFMFQIIHDLKNPTISLKNGTELAQEKLEVLETFKEYQIKMQE